jgi:glutamyl-tRNA synthetase
MAHSNIRVRFAPSPTGHLHVGNVRTALFNWLLARRHQGTFILRIEDTDLERSQPEYEQLIYEDLRWFGLDWDEGPDVGGNCGPYRQSERLAIYRDFAERLLRAGQAYHCFCTPEELDAEREQAKAQGALYVYSGRCRNLPLEEAHRRVQSGVPFTIRFQSPPGQVSWDDLVRGTVQWDAGLLGDFVIIKSDGWPVYNFAVVVDDGLMNITHVIRGDGHLPNTPRQILIYQALRAEMPKFAHLSTILGSDGSKLSKRHGATSIAEFREQGYRPEALMNFLALLGWSPEGEREVLSRQELIEHFSLERVGKAPAIFDSEKLNWMNRAYLKLADPIQLVEPAAEYLKRAGRITDEPLADSVRAWLRLVVEVALTYLDSLSQIVRETGLIFEYPLEAAAQSEEVREILDEAGALEVIRALDEELQSAASPLTWEAFQAAVNTVKQRTGRKGKALFHPIRVALTLRASGPELAKLIPIYEHGSRLDLPRPILSVRDRLRAFLSRAEMSETR